MLSKEEFEECLYYVKERGGQYVTFEVKGFDGDRRELLAYDSYEKYLADMNNIGFKLEDQ